MGSRVASFQGPYRVLMIRYSLMVQRSMGDMCFGEPSTR